MSKKLPAWIVLTVITLVAALALGFTYDSTKDTIDAQEAQKAVAVRQALLPEAQRFDLVESVDAISGATITTNAVLTGIDQAYETLGGAAGTATGSVLDPARAAQLT